MTFVLALLNLAVLKYAANTGAQAIAGRFTPSSFTNYITRSFKEYPFLFHYHAILYRIRLLQITNGPSHLTCPRSQHNPNDRSSPCISPHRVPLFSSCLHPNIS